MSEFAEAEIIHNTGPFQGRRLRFDRQPFSRLLIREFDRLDPVTKQTYWRRRNVTGPQQCGKTLFGSIMPVLYHCFEIGETVVYGVPSLDTVSDKWFEDLLPAIEKTRYRDLLPAKGGGSRGGRVSAVRFLNGATLRFMTGGGDDKARASFTARVLIVTETDGFGRAAQTSEEGDKLSQLEGRTRAYKDRRLIYQECTVTTPDAPTWHAHETGSCSWIATPCPHCRNFVQMEREQLMGWQESETEEDARAQAHWQCPSCGHAISESERIAMNQMAILVHRGQEITPEGAIHGPMPPTRTLGFRWSAFHNLFTNAAELAAEEFAAKLAADEQNAEKKLCQFIWCKPYVPPELDEAPLDPKEIMRRHAPFQHRLIPADTVHLVCAVDIGKWQSWYLLLCARANGTLHIPDYGVIEVHSDSMDEKMAIRAALREFRDVLIAGWPQENATKPRVPDEIWVDAGHEPGIIHECVKAFGTFPDPSGCWFAAIGRGTTSLTKSVYRAPQRIGNEIRRMGDGWFLAKTGEHKSYQITFDADRAKLALQAAVRLPLLNAAGEPIPGSLSLYDPGVDKGHRDRHNKLGRHFASEQLQERMIDGKGLVREWVKHGQNHWLDCGAMCERALRKRGWKPAGEDAVAPQPNSPTQAGGGWFASAQKTGPASRDDDPV